MILSCKGFNVYRKKSQELDGIQEISNIQKEHVRIELEDDNLFGAICNSTSVGGVLTLSFKSVDMSDGKFDILFIRTPKDIQELHECIISIRNKTYNCGMITFRSVKSISVIGGGNMVWSLDGKK